MSDPTKTPDDGFTATPSGLLYRDEAMGEGAEPVTGRVVTVHYTGWLADGRAPGRKFDSSRDRGTPFSFGFGTGEVIAGWDVGLAGMRIGGRRRLLIPAELGYGARGAGGVIPPHASLIFDVELLGVG